MDSGLALKVCSAPRRGVPDEAVQAFWDSANVGLYTVRVLGQDAFEYDSINPAHERATGLCYEEIVGRGPQECLPPETAQLVMGHYADCVRSGAPVLYTETLKLPSGEKIWQTNLVPVRNRSGAVHLLVGCCRDITDVVSAEREVARRLVDIQEEERRRISEELHDSTTQHLVAVQLRLAVLRREGARAEILDEMGRELAEAHKEIRTLSYLLHPPELAREGLAATLRSYIDGFAVRTGASAVLDLGGDLESLSLTAQREIFRVVQESMANAHRHAKARRITITLHRCDDGLRLSVADDGRRPGAPAPSLRHGVGIPGMTARMERLGGTLDVAAREAGVVVSAFIPAPSLGPASELQG